MFDMNKLNYKKYTTDHRFKEICSYTLDRVMEMFHVKHLPDTIPEHIVKEMLLTFGYCYITDKYNGKDIYAYVGGFGGEPDVYYEPTRIIISNPHQKFFADLSRKDDGVLIRNDTNMIGCLHLIKRYAASIAETETSLRVANINSRILSIIISSTGADKESADIYLSKIENGDLSAILTKDFADNGVDTRNFQNASGSGNIKDLIELLQYQKASLLNELGLQANWNAKREAIGENESALNNDFLYPLVDNMLKCWSDGFEKVNDKYGTDIKVELSSAWKDNKLEEKLTLDIMKKEGEKDETGTDDSRERTVSEPDRE